MNLTRRQFVESLGLTAAALSGCRCPPFSSGIHGKIALQLYAIRHYIRGLKGKDGKVLVPARGIEKALEEVAKIGFCGVEFYGYFGFDAKAIGNMLRANGLVAVGSHVDIAKYGLNTKTWTYDPDVLKRTCAFNLAYGNDLVICPGDGAFPPGVNWPIARAEADPCKPSQAIDDHIRRLVEFYNRIAADAAKIGCRVGFHNHTWEHRIRLLNGISIWDYFFTNTDPAVCMEQDVGWTTCAGVDPKEQFRKYPRRSPTLHAKENGMGRNVAQFDAILGQPGRDAKGAVCSVPVDWDGLLPVAESNGVKWWIVECERHFDDFSAVTPSYEFLRAKGLKGRFDA